MATDWQAIKLEYINSPLSLKEIAEKHDLKDATVRQRAHREDWEAERHALSQSVTQAAQEQLTDDRTNQLAKFNEYHNAIWKNSYRWFFLNRNISYFFIRH